MVLRFAIPGIVALGAAWVLVQPDTPRPEARPDMPPEVAAAEPEVAEPDTAIALLGETWSVGAPAPIERPLTAAEHEAVRAALRQPATGTPESRTQIAAVPDLRRPRAAPRAFRADGACRVRGAFRAVGQGGRAVAGPRRNGPATAGHRLARRGTRRLARRWPDALGRQAAGQRVRRGRGSAFRGARHPDIAPALTVRIQGALFRLWDLKNLGYGTRASGVRVSAVSPRLARMYAQESCVW